jgi:hypothetical protein
MMARTDLLKSSLFAAVFIVGCNKDTAKPTSTATLPTIINTNGTMNLNLTYPYKTITGTFELIINEPGGKVLIDSLAQDQIPIILALKTNANLVDVTYIYVLDSNQSIPTYAVCVYKDVNPSKWVNLRTGELGITYPKSATVQSNLTFTNYPTSAITTGNVFNSFIFENGIRNDYTNALYYDAYNTLALTYQSHNGVDDYFVIPQLGLYKLFLPTGNDTLDISVMDTVSSVTFVRNTPFTLIYPGCIFNGIPDTTDLSKSVSFLDIFNTVVPPNADMQFPKTPMQKYEIGVAAMNSVNDYPYYYGYVSSPPTQLSFPDASSFSVVSQQNDNFGVTFTNPNLSSFCTTYIADATVQVNFWSPPDSTAFQPISFLTIQKSKLLNGVSLSDLTLKTFQFTNVPGFTYADYLDYVCNPNLVQTHKITTYTSYLRAF